MKILKMAKRDLDLFVAVLPAFGEVYAPVQRGDGFSFERPSLWSDVRMDYTRTMLPPKKLMLPPRETTFAFDPEKGFQDHLAEAAKPMVLFGVHSYDIYGLNILDRVFAQSKFPDPYYIARRKATAIIGVDFVPDEKHTAGSMNADFVDQRVRSLPQRYRQRLPGARRDEPRRRHGRHERLPDAVPHGGRFRGVQEALQRPS